MPTIPPTGREYITWPITGADPGTALEASTGGDWFPLERPTTTTARILAAGPEATGNPPGTLVLAIGRNRVTIRATDTPELVIRSGGDIYVKVAN
jgi:hypothetical protein